MPRWTMTLPERFWSKVDRRGPDECWPWTAHTQAKGYGTFGIGNRPYPAHRVAYELTHGVVPDTRIFVCHSCDTPGCCNPAHLFLGSHDDNMADMKAKRRARNAKKTHCALGHPLQEPNLVPHLAAKGIRRCRECNNARMRKSSHE